jgi:hypothetical protein
MTLNPQQTVVKCNLQSGQLIESFREWIESAVAYANSLASDPSTTADHIFVSHNADDGLKSRRDAHDERQQRVDSEIGVFHRLSLDSAMALTSAAEGRVAYIRELRVGFTRRRGGLFHLHSWATSFRRHSAAVFESCVHIKSVVNRHEACVSNNIAQPFKQVWSSTQLPSAAITLLRDRR